MRLGLDRIAKDGMARELLGITLCFCAGERQEHGLKSAPAAIAKPVGKLLSFLDL